MSCRKWFPVPQKHHQISSFDFLSEFRIVWCVRVRKTIKSKFILKSCSFFLFGTIIHIEMLSALISLQNISPISTSMKIISNNIHWFAYDCLSFLLHILIFLGYFRLSKTQEEIASDNGQFAAWVPLLHKTMFMTVSPEAIKYKRWLSRSLHLVKHSSSCTAFSVVEKAKSWIFPALLLFINLTMFETKYHWLSPSSRMEGPCLLQHSPSIIFCTTFWNSGQFTVSEKHKKLSQWTWN